MIHMKLTRQICTDMLHMRDKSLAETYCADFLFVFLGEKSKKLVGVEMNPVILLNKE